ncbi:MAG TPA: LPS export ABC transporter periplasmic protein LptC [Cyclobacteriaceae bacterium]|nr:LPS export ABC transporter periplasmic protein LptC [Cyclobacteriaceae bacterium]
MYRYLIFLVVGYLIASCTDTGTKEILVYEGPISEAENVEHYYTENDLVKVKLLAALVYEYQNGDKEFPKGLYLEFYNEFGRISSTLRANHAYYFKKEDQWRGQGNVEVKNIEKNEQLNSEELYWKPKDQKIFTEKFVTIRLQSDVIYGEGLEAKQDLSSYKILKPSGTLEINE